MMLERGDLLPMFVVTNLRDGARVAYQTIWQHRELILVTVPPDDPTTATYIASLEARAEDLQAGDARLVITSDPIEGMPVPGVLVADQWGEVHYVHAATRAADLPDAGELAEWLLFVQMQCPECQGETR